MHVLIWTVFLVLHIPAQLFRGGFYSIFFFTVNLWWSFHPWRSKFQDPISTIINIFLPIFIIFLDCCCIYILETRWSWPVVWYFRWRGGNIWAKYINNELNWLCLLIYSFRTSVEQLKSILFICCIFRIIIQEHGVGEDVLQILSHSIGCTTSEIQVIWIKMVKHTVRSSAEHTYIHTYYAYL